MIFFAVEVSIILLRILAKKTDMKPAVENKIIQIEKQKRFDLIYFFTLVPPVSIDMSLLIIKLSVNTIYAFE